MVDLKSVNFGNFNSSKNIYDDSFMNPTINVDRSLLEDSDNFLIYIVPDFQEMRIDLIVGSIYGNINNKSAMEAIDIILALNEIDNPLNIMGGMRIIYPSNLENINNFRVADVKSMKEESQSTSVLGKANKNTRVDNRRKAFIENGYSLPPTVNKTPVSPIRIEDNSFLIGGVK